MSQYKARKLPNPETGRPPSNTSLKQEEQIVGTRQEYVDKREEQIVGTRQEPQWIVLQRILSHLQ